MGATKNSHYLRVILLCAAKHVIGAHDFFCKGACGNDIRFLADNFLNDLIRRKAETFPVEHGDGNPLFAQIAGNIGNPYPRPCARHLDDVTDGG